MQRNIDLPHHNSQTSNSEYDDTQTFVFLVNVSTFNNTLLLFINIPCQFTVLFMIVWAASWFGNVLYTPQN